MASSVAEVDRNAASAAMIADKCTRLLEIQKVN